MIRFAKDDDIAGIINLWDEAFGYDDFGKWYFRNVFEIDNTLVYEEDNNIIAMLQRIPYKIKDIGDATYIYGACTAKEYRNRGIMSKLLVYSEVIDMASGVDAIFLVPENEGLFEFYEKKGYTRHFYKYIDYKEKESKVATDNKGIDIKKCIKMAKDYNIKTEDNGKDTIKDNIKVYEVSKENINHIMKKFDVDKDHIDAGIKKYATDMIDVYVKANENRNYIIRNQSYFSKQISMHIETGGKVYVFYEKNELIGYAFGYVENGIYEISELVSKKTDYNDKIYKLLNDKYSRIKVLNQLNGSIKVKYGCVKLLRKMLNVNKIIINLVFD